MVKSYVNNLRNLLRETRLLQIWTGTNDIQNLIIQHEFYKELLSRTVDERNIEADIHLSS